MKEMDKKYLQSPANTSNSKFETFNSMYRLKGETTESFILKYELAYDDLVKADPEVKCSERLLTLNALAHLQVYQKDKSNIIHHMKAWTTRDIVDSVESRYGKDGVPWVPITHSSPKGIDKNIEQAMVHDEMFENDDDKIENSEDASYWSKGRGKGQYKSPDRSIVCKRCGYPGHESHMCKLDWAKAQKHLSENPLKSGDVALSAFLCPDCGHPDCEGPDEDSDSTSEFFF